MKKISLFFFIQLIVLAGIAQTMTGISGRVIDSASHSVAGASVHILNTNAGAVTNNQGAFTFEHLYRGNYIIRVSAIGYADVTREITAANKTAPLNITIFKAPSVLEEVVVTAQKTEQLSQDVPVSITSLSARQVEDYRLWNSKEITAIVPNLYSADPGDKRNVTSIRGITTTSYDPAVATYIDGVNQFSLDTYIAQLFDVDRIEVLRGPQGTLYGRNAMGGVINIITKQPENKTTGFAEISYGNHGLQRYSAGIKAPVIKDKLFFGVAALYDRFNGFYTNEYNNSKFDKQNTFTGNYYLKYLPSQNLSFTLNIKHNNSRNNGTFPLVSGVAEAFANPFKLSQNAITKLIDNTFNSSLSVTYAGRNFNFNSQTAYQSDYRYYKDPIDGDFSPIDGVTLINNYGKDWNKVKVYTQEFRFSSPASHKSPFNWTAGTYLFHQNNPVKQATRFGNDAEMVGAPDTDFSLINTTKAQSNGIAFYGQATYSLTRKLDITAGVRYDYEKKKQDILGEYQHDPNPLPVYAYRTDTSASAAFHAFSPRVTAGYKISSQNLLFFTYSKGFRAGGLTPLSSDPSQPALYSYQPEYSNNFEAGIKNTFFKKRLLINFTAFYTTVTNAQVPTLILPDAVTITRNTGGLKSKGAELETSALLKGFQLDYNFGYTDADFTNLKLAENGSEVDLKGKKQIFTPDVTSMFAGQYNISLSKKKDVKLIVRGEWKYLGKQYFDLANTISQSSYSLFNSKIEFSAPKFSVIIWGRNLANKKYISYAYDFGAVHLGDPKTYGITARVSI